MKNNNSPSLPLISIIMPAFNVSSWINAAIESIQRQTYNHFELIIVDDCSTDDTFEKASQFSNNDSRIKVFKNKKNLKICKTLNYGLKLAKGEYIARIDADDLAAPQRLEKQLAYLQNNNIDLVGCQMIAIDENNIEFSYSELPIGCIHINKTRLIRSPIAHIWLCKKSVYDKLNGYRDIPYAEDYDFILRAIDYGFKCDNSPEYLMRIRHRGGNTATTASLAQRKTHNYVVNLAIEREKNNNKDTFSSEILATRIKSNNIVKALHKISSKYLNLAIKEHSFLKKILFIIISSITSFYNFQYLYRKLKYNITIYLNK